MVFSLWDESLIKNSIFKDEPSPAKSEKSIFTFLNYISQIHFYMSPIGRTPKLTPSYRFIRGSMTVEATILVPLLLFAVMHIFGVVEMLRLRSNITYGLWRIGETLTVGEALVGQDDGGIGIVEDVIGSVAMSTYFQKVLGSEYLESSPLVHGAKGLNVMMSDYRNEEDCVDIVVTYQVEPPVTIFPFPYTRMANRYYARAFTGFDVADDADMVYVAEYGTVWHMSAECSYIYVPLTKVDKQKVMTMETSDGGAYKPCENCGKEAGVEVYITQNGERYHSSGDCSALRRHVRAVSKTEVQDWNSCSRCGKEEG